MQALERDSVLELSDGGTPGLVEQLTRPVLLVVLPLTLADQAAILRQHALPLFLVVLEVALELLALDESFLALASPLAQHPGALVEMAQRLDLFPSVAVLLVLLERSLVLGVAVHLHALAAHLAFLPLSFVPVHRAEYLLPEAVILLVLEGPDVEQVAGLDEGAVAVGLVVFPLAQVDPPVCESLHPKMLF